jgi:hypothetical protein
MTLGKKERVIQNLLEGYSYTISFSRTHRQIFVVLEQTLFKLWHPPPIRNYRFSVSTILFRTPDVNDESRFHCIFIWKRDFIPQQLINRSWTMAEVYMLWSSCYSFRRLKNRTKGPSLSSQKPTIAQPSLRLLDKTQLAYSLVFSLPPNSVALSPQANYTDWVTATCRRNLVPTFVDRGVSHCQRGGSLTVVNLSFLDRSR